MGSLFCFIYIHMKDIESKKDLRIIVNDFYSKARKDGLIGPFFENTVQIDWPNHLEKITNFWETTLFGNITYKGNPMQVHLHLHQLRKMEQQHFNRWIELFHESVDKYFSGQKAHELKTRALSISTMIHIKTYQS